MERLELDARAPRRRQSSTGAPPRRVRLGPGEERDARVQLRCERWGAYRVGDLALRVRERFGLLAYEGRVDRRPPPLPTPGPSRLRALVAPLETQPPATRWPA